MNLGVAQYATLGPGGNTGAFLLHNTPSQFLAAPKGTHMDLFKAFATDDKLEVEGRWVSFDPETKFKIARANNKFYSRLLSRLYNKHKVLLESKGDAAEAKSDEILIEVMAKTVLLDWSGPVMINGKDLSTYSLDNAKKALAIKDFRRWVSAQSEDFDSFKAVQEAEDEKN
jgi:hypothetical protein